MKNSVSTEAWRFDDRHDEDCDRWSYKKYGEEWKTARVFGKVVGKVGQKWLVEWEDNQQTTVESSTLQLENQDAEDNVLQDLERDDDTDSRLSGYFSSDEDEESWLNEVTDFEDDEDPDYFPLKAHSTQHSQSSDNDDSFSQSSAPAKNVSLRQYSSASNKVPSITSDTNEPCCSYTETLSCGENSVCSQSDGNPSPNLLGFHDACTPVHEVTEPASSSSIECDLHKGEDVLLKYENFSIFKAAFLTIDSEPLLGQFAVEQLLRDANQWKDFDPDKHAPASIVKWSLNKVDKLPFPIVEDLGTEARQPTLLDTRKRIRNEQLWQKNIKKTKYNAGEEYQFKNKKGETFTKPSRRELKEEKCCNSSCRQ